MVTEIKNKITFLQLIPFWGYVFLFQLAGALHYTMLAPIGERILPIWLVGIIIGAGAFMQLLLDIPAGHILDRKGYLKMLYITTILFIIAAVVLTFKLSPLTFILTLFIGGLGWLFYGSGTPAYMLAVSPEHLAGKYMGIKDAAKSGGTVIAVLLLSLALKSQLQEVAIFLAITFLTALVLLAFAKSETNSLTQADKKLPTHHYFIRRHPISHFWRTIKRFNPVTTTLLLQNFAASLFYAVVWFTIPLALIHQTQTGWTESGLAVFDLAVVVLGGALGYIVDKWKKKMLVLIGLLIFATASTVLGFSWGVWFFVLGFLATSGEELSGLALWAWLNHLDRDHAEDGYIAGVITFFSDFGWTVGPIMAGFLYGLVGPKLTIMTGGLFLVGTFLIYTIIAFTHRHLFQFKIKPAPSQKPRLYKHKH